MDEEDKGVMKNWIIFILFVGLLVFTVIYISDKNKEAVKVKEAEIFNNGTTVGYQTAINQLVQAAVTCEQIPINVNNQTINLIAVECLQQR